MNRKYLTALTAIAAAAWLPASAAGQSITAISAIFANQNPASVDIDNSDPNDIRVCWPGAGVTGCSTLGAPGLSGYSFERSAVPIAAGLTPFNLGQFTHFNFPITLGTQLQTVDLQFSYTIGGASPSNFGDSWTLTHEETSNTALPCAYAGGNPCADRVSFNLTTGGGPTQFSFGGNLYQISLLGFGDTAEEAGLEPEFITFEGELNTTSLWAQVTEVPRGTVPEPATMTLLATGLVGLAATRRRRRRK